MGVIDDYIKEKLKDKNLKKKLILKKHEIEIKVRMWTEAQNKLKHKRDILPTKYYAPINKEIQDYQEIINKYKKQIEEINKYI